MEKMKKDRRGQGNQGGQKRKTKQRSQDRKAPTAQPERREIERNEPTEEAAKEDWDNEMGPGE